MVLEFSREVFFGQTTSSGGSAVLDDFLSRAQMYRLYGDREEEETQADLQPSTLALASEMTLAPYSRGADKNVVEGTFEVVSSEEVSNTPPEHIISIGLVGLIPYLNSLASQIIYKFGPQPRAYTAAQASKT